MSTYTALELEKDILELEGIVLIIRCSKGTQVGEYTNTIPVGNDVGIQRWIHKHVTSLIGDYEVSVISGMHVEPHRLMTMGDLRRSYFKDS